MKKLKYIQDFENLGIGMFVHFGLYSVIGKGEWYKFAAKMETEEYNRAIDKFKIKKSWARELVSTAKKQAFAI